MNNPTLRKIYACCENVYEKSIEIYKYWATYLQFRGAIRKNVYSKIKLTDKQKKQIDDFYIKNYGCKIPYIYHQYCTAFTGRFDVQYFPDLVYYPKFEKYMHHNRAYTRVLADKNLLPILTLKAGVKTPQVFLSRVSGVFRDKEGHSVSRKEFEKMLSDMGEVFIKPSVDSYGGANCAVIDMAKGIDKNSGKTTAQIIKQLGFDFIVQERLSCHESIAKIYPSSVNTFRIITYQWRDKIYHCPVAMRLGSGGSTVDNVSSGGMFLALEDDGTLHDTAFNEKNVHYTKHPDTQLVFKGYVIPNVDKMIKAAIRMHELLPQIGLCHWDFTLDINGEAVLLEMNLGTGGIRPAQMSHGKGLFGKNTAEILQWTAKMKKLSFTERKKYGFGYMETQK